MSKAITTSVSSRPAKTKGKSDVDIAKSPQYGEEKADAQPQVEVGKASTATTTKMDIAEIKIRKATDAIGLRVEQGTLSLLGMKVFNALIVHAQSGRLGADAPIDDEASRQYYWVPVATIAALSSFNSKDTALIKQTLVDLQNVRLHLEDSQRWVSETLLASIVLAKADGLNSKSNAPLYLGFAFPPQVQSLLVTPNQYAGWMMLYQGALRSRAAAALYEVCRRYATNPSKLTNIAEYETYWFHVLTGATVETPAPPYKYFKRDTLTRAMVEVNTLTDIKVHLVEHKVGRKVVSLQWRVQLNPQKQIEFPAAPLVDSVLIEQVEQLGFKPEVAVNITVEYGVTAVREALQILAERQANVAKGMTPLENPLAYFRWALDGVRDGTVGSTMLRLEPKAKKPRASNSEKGTKAATALERYEASQAAKALVLIGELSDAERQALIEEFRQSPDAQGLQIKGWGSSLTRRAVSAWYARTRFGEPTPEDLSMFLESESQEVRN